MTQRDGEYIPSDKSSSESCKEGSIGTVASIDTSIGTPNTGFSQFIDEVFLSSGASTPTKPRSRKYRFGLKKRKRIHLFVTPRKGSQGKKQRTSSPVDSPVITPIESPCSEHAMLG